MTRKSSASSASSEAARERFADFAAGADEAIDLAEAALCIAAEHVEFDMPACLAQLADLADRARPALERIATRPLAERVDRFNQHMFRDEGFRGCEQHDYYQPRQSFLNEVLERRSGIPISLSIVYVDVSRRLGLRSFGVSFPGHFLAKIDPDSASPRSEPAHAGDDSIIVDPFIGRALSRDECSDRLERAIGPQADLNPDSASQWLAAASPREILVRVLGNLKQNYLACEDWPAALACADRSLLLLPDSPLELRDRGLLYRKLECFGAAVDDLERFLELAPQHESAAVARDSLSAMRRHPRTIH